MAKSSSKTQPRVPSAPARAPRSRRWLEPACVVGLLGVYFLLATTAASTKSATFDEPLHLLGGYTYWTQNDYRIQPENGNLPQRLVALPLVLGGVAPPDTNSDFWRNSDMFGLSRQWLFQLGNDAGHMLWLGRAMIALVGVALGALIYVWAKRLWGVAGALLSLTLYCLFPGVLANTLCTSDLCVSFFFLASVAAFWRYLDNSSWANLALSCVTMAGLFVAKYSASLVLPMVAIMAGVQWRRASWRWSVAAACHAAAVALAIWAAYGFRWSMFAGEGVQQIAWEVLHQRGGMVTQLLAALQSLKLLPEAYLYGSAHVYVFAQARPSFLDGDVQITGSWLFFPKTFLYKTPLVLLIVLGLSYAARSVRKAAGQATSERSFVPLFTLIGVYFVAAVCSNLNIGHRHLLPIYPALFILAGGAAGWFLGPRRWQRWVLAASLLVYVANTLFTWPNYLAYVNVLAGGVKNGYRHVADSSLDWGQDLPALKKWLDERAPGERIQLAYFGTDDPRRFQIDYDDIGSYYGQTHGITGLRPGLFCISATILDGLYASTLGRWHRDAERQYQEYFQKAAQWDREVARLQAGGQQAVNVPPEWSEAINLFEAFRLGRLCAYLRQRQPMAVINGSILVFRLNEQDVASVMTGPPAELAPVPEWSKADLWEPKSKTPTGTK